MSDTSGGGVPGGFDRLDRHEKTHKTDGPDEPDRLDARTSAIEEAYEFFLAYASQGFPTEPGAGHEIRAQLGKFDAALTGLAEFFTGHITELGLDPAPYRRFIAVLDRDAKDSQAAIHMVLAQKSISSQIIDSLNASIHVRALLTDLFLIDEIIKAQRA